MFLYRVFVVYVGGLGLCAALCIGVFVHICAVKNVCVRVWR